MLERVANIIDLFLDQLLLLLFDVELLFTIVSESKVVDVFDKLLRDVFKSIVATGQKKECLDIVFSTTRDSSLQRCYFFVNRTLRIC